MIWKYWGLVYFVYLIFYIFFSFIFYPLSSSLISDLTDLAYGIRYVNACESLFTPGLGVYVVIGIHSNLFIALAGGRGGRRTGWRELVEGGWFACSGRRRKRGRARASKPERRVSTDEKSSRFFGS